MLTTSHYILLCQFQHNSSKAEHFLCSLHFYKKLKLRSAEEQWVSKSLCPLCQTARQVEGVPSDAAVLWGMIHLLYCRQLGFNYSHPEVSTSLHQSLRESRETGSWWEDSCSQGPHEGQSRHLSSLWEMWHSNHIQVHMGCWELLPLELGLFWTLYLREIRLESHLSQESQNAAVFMNWLFCPCYYSGWQSSFCV